MAIWFYGLIAMRRGFTKERHTVLKAAVSIISLGGFVLAWAGFSAGHDRTAASSEPVEELPATATPTASSAPPRTTTSTARGTATPSPTPLPTRAAVTPRARQSRGS